MSNSSTSKAYSHTEQGIAYRYSASRLAPEKWSDLPHAMVAAKVLVMATALALLTARLATARAGHTTGARATATRPPGHAASAPPPFCLACTGPASSGRRVQLHLGILCQSLTGPKRQDCDHILAAIEFINNKTDSFFDHILPGIEIVAALVEVGCAEVPSRVPPALADLFASLPHM